jgi:hypothetical protein
VTSDRFLQQNTPYIISFIQPEHTKNMKKRKNSLNSEVSYSRHRPEQKWSKNTQGKGKMDKKVAPRSKTMAYRI